MVEIFKPMNKVSGIIPFSPRTEEKGERREARDSPAEAKPHPGSPGGSGSICLGVRAAEWPQQPAELPSRGLKSGGRFQVTGPSLQVPGSPAGPNRHAATPQNACLLPPATPESLGGEGAALKGFQESEPREPRCAFLALCGQAMQSGPAESQKGRTLISVLLLRWLPAWQPCGPSWLRVQLLLW